MSTHKLTKLDFLTKSFNIYNRRYFGGALPATEVVFGKTTENSDGNFLPAKGKIVIASYLKGHDVLVSIVLLHEMAHVKLEATYVGGTVISDPHHGMIYQAELVRLFNAGAYDGLL